MIRIIGMMFCVCLAWVANSQNTRYGIKLGPTVGFQKWNYFQNDPLYKYHGAFWIESYQDEDPFSIFAQLGYHKKGSATRYYGPIQIDNQIYDIPTDEFIFNNLSLQVGVKKKFPWGKALGYYAFGLRGEYTVSTNLNSYDWVNQFIPIYPFNSAVKRVLVGFTLGGGVELPFGALAGSVLELNISPDLTRQYYQPQINNIIDIYQPGRITTIPEKSIKNLTLELSLGVYFTRKVVYID